MGEQWFYTSSQKKRVVNAGYKSLKALLASEALNELLVPILLGKVLHSELLKDYGQELYLVPEGLELRGPGSNKCQVPLTRKLVEACELRVSVLDKLREKLEA